MDITLDELPAFLNKLADFVYAVADAGVVEVAAAVDELAVKATPVDTGLARSNWIVTVGSPTDIVIPPYAEGSLLGLSETANAEYAIAQGNEALSSYKRGQPVYVQNNVDYIGILNDGTSRQAPALFVELSIKGGVELGMTALKNRLDGLSVKTRG